MYKNYLEKLKYNLLRTKSAETFYYANIMFALITVWEEKINTAGVDGKHLFINPAFLMGLTMPQAIGLIAHEMCHIVYQHLTMFKIYNRKVFSEAIEHKLWNMAGDHVINLALLALGYELPPGGLWDARFTGMTTVEVYRILHDEYRANPFPLPKGDIIIIPGDDSAAKRKRSKQEDHIRKIMVKAAVATQKNKNLDWGNVSADLKRVIQEVENPKLDFTTILWNYMSKYKADDYSYRRPNRRYLDQGLYLPTLYSEAVCDLALIFDVSGSVDDATLSIFYRALWQIKLLLNPEKITLVQFDTMIVAEEEITDLEQIKRLKFGGGGGTIIHPVIDWIKKNKPEVTLIFTDGGFGTQQERAGSDIIWIIQGNPNFTAPEGLIIHHDM